MKAVKTIDEYNSLPVGNGFVIEFGTPETCIPCKFANENLKKFEENKKFNLTYYECSDINVISNLGYSSVPVIVLTTPHKKVELADSSVSMDEEELESWINQNIGE